LLWVIVFVFTRYEIRSIDADQKRADEWKQFGKRVEVTPSDLERFVSEQNIARYRKVLGESKDETQRLTIPKLLADEVAKLRKM
jgi:hypothetical protein